MGAKGRAGGELRYYNRLHLQLKLGQKASTKINQRLVLFVLGFSSGCGGGLPFLHLFAEGFD
jgi:hypothetical protein